jgi:hypothetical protein
MVLIFLERARLYRLRKNSTDTDDLKGHGFIRAAKASRIEGALAPEGCFFGLCIFSA